jgi:hypothetical protein
MTLPVRISFNNSLLLFDLNEIKEVKEIRCITFGEFKTCEERDNVIKMLPKYYKPHKVKGYYYNGKEMKSWFSVGFEFNKKDERKKINVIKRLKTLLN